MKYRYSWNHILLFAQMCDCEDTKTTVTENWVKMLEGQQEDVFPFTLWPLTYRTSAVIASTSLLSPSISTVSTKKGEPACQVVLKVYKSNDVIIMCFQHVGDHAGSTCPELCKFNTDAVKKGHGIHSKNKRHSLVPCGLMNMYSRIKKKAMIELTKVRSHGDLSCIICTGYEIGAILATFMACDLANEFKSEAEFMGLDQPMITVDCVCFSIPKVANNKYWEDFDSLVDEHVSVKHREEVLVENPKPVVFVGNKDVPLRTKKLYFIHLNKKSPPKVRCVPCSRYVEGIDQKLRIPFHELRN